MALTYRQVERHVTFPVFYLPSSNWSEQDGLLYLDGRLLDDRNMPGETLGLRRLQTPFKDLYPLDKSMIDIVGLIKNTNDNSYIDMLGNHFTYHKSVFSQIKYYKISRVEGRDSASLIWLKGINFPFKQPRPPLSDNNWAGVLHIQGRPWIIYEFSPDKKADTRRKI